MDIIRKRGFIDMDIDNNMNIYKHISSSNVISRLWSYMKL